MGKRRTMGGEKGREKKEEGKKKEKKERVIGGGGGTGQKSKGILQMWKRNAIPPSRKILNQNTIMKSPDNYQEKKGGGERKGKKVTSEP